MLWTLSIPWKDAYKIGSVITVTVSNDDVICKSSWILMIMQMRWSQVDITVSFCKQSDAVQVFLCKVEKQLTESVLYRNSEIQIVVLHSGYSMTVKQLFEKSI